ncbi:MAG TPA: hypothetical protein VGR35_00305 [Tepidisphaeraceae bacterium]|nr:hypothetical protein [Tepidisphaeraceae bacterium]
MNGQVRRDIVADSRSRYHCGMGFPCHAFSVVIASPSDLADERVAAREAIHDWNDLHAEAEAVALLPLMCETHGTPQSGDRPQAILNKQIVDKADLLIGMFWTKIGTNTGVAESGTVEELNRIVAAGKTAMLYFSKRPIDPNKIDLKQMKKLKAFKDETYQKALVGGFTSPDELRQTLLRDLTRQVREMKAKFGTKADKPDEVPVTAAGREEELSIKTQCYRDGHIRWFFVDLTNWGADLYDLDVSLRGHHPDDTRAFVCPLHVKGPPANPLKRGQSRRFMTANDDRDKWAWDIEQYRIDHIKVVVSSGVREVKSFTADQFASELKAFAMPDPTMPPKPPKPVGKKPPPKVTYMDLPRSAWLDER